MCTLPHGTVTAQESGTFRRALVLAQSAWPWVSGRQVGGLFLAGRIGAQAGYTRYGASRMHSVCMAPVENARLRSGGAIACRKHSSPVEVKREWLEVFCIASPSRRVRRTRDRRGDRSSRELGANVTPRMSPCGSSSCYEQVYQALAPAKKDVAVRRLAAESVRLCPARTVPSVSDIASLKRVPYSLQFYQRARI